MNILMISLDKSLLAQQEHSESISRHKDYGKYVGNLFIICFNLKSPLLSPIHQINLSKNVAVYPTHSSSRLFYIIDGFKVANKIFTKNSIQLITTQDPLLTGLLGIFLKWRYKIPTLIGIHGSFFDKRWIREQWINPFLYLLGRYVVKKSDFIRVVSRQAKSELLEYGIHKNKIFIAPVPVKLETFSKYNNDTVQYLKKCHAGRKIILQTSTLTKTKNVLMLLNALHKIKEQAFPVHLWLIGSVPEKKNLIAYTNRLKLNNDVSFLGQLPQMELVNYYHAADIFVLASYNESFGRVLLEAAMAKKPIIAAQYRGPLDIFSDRKSALFFNPNSTSSLVEQIVHLLENPQIAFQLGVEAYNDVNRRFSYEKNIHKIMESWNLSVVPQHLI